MVEEEMNKYQKLIRELEEDDSIVIHAVKIEPGVKAGENYLSKIQSIKFSGSKGANASKSFFTKN